MTDDTSAYAAAARAQTLVGWIKERDFESAQKMIDGLNSAQRAELAIAAATLASRSSQPVSSE